MHRDKTHMDDPSENNPVIYNEADGSIFKGIEEILREGGDDCIAEDDSKMPKVCSKSRRMLFNFPSATECMPDRRCCLVNTLRCRQDFKEQKCCLEEACESVGAKFIMLMMCHPECNPIEDFWNCTKRCTRETCDYTLKGLRAILPDAFLSVKPHWVRKSFERSDRYLALYSMEHSAMPFGLREFMVKC